jgi:hypothetical protein
MKKMLVGLMFMAGLAGAACNGPFCFDDSGAYIVGQDLQLQGGGDLMQGTTNQFHVRTPKQAGSLVYCTTLAQVCVSTGTGTGAYVEMASTTTTCAN